MTTINFTDKDFDVFLVPGLDGRMEALIERVRPKLTVLGNELTPFLSALAGEEMFSHVAKHARRTVNPPKDTWVAWANNKRGYKQHPHFQVGLWSSHLFIQFAIIYECVNKKTFAEHLSQNLPTIIKQIPDNFFWSRDHMQPGVTPHAMMSEQDLLAMSERLVQVNKAEALCGLIIQRDDPILKDGQALLSKIEETFNILLPLYKMAF